ncbi:MAG: putative asparagine synthetase, partial [Gaeavirus sp.]
DPVMRMPTEHNGIRYEKWLLRESFDGLNLLPEIVLWRRKEAFSDGVSSESRSWYQIIQEKLDTEITKDDLVERQKKYVGFTSPYTKEALK